MPKPLRSSYQALAAVDPSLDCAVMVRDGKVEAVENVSARGREAPLLGAVEWAVSLRG